MDRIKDQPQLDKMSGLLASFTSKEFSLVGLSDAMRRSTLAAQIVDSVRRIEYLRLTAAKAKSELLHTPYSGSFQPLGGAAALQKAGQIDDAYWLVYLATHFGRHKIDGWNLVEDFYGRFGQGGIWDWATASANPQAISQWLAANHPQVTKAGRSRRFGNHRKFETLKPGSKGTGHAVGTYINWVLKHGSHQALIASAQANVGQNPQEVFGYLFKSLKEVAKLGRLGKFDFLCNLSNLQIAPIAADQAYIAGSTGPKDGARLLFGNGLSIARLERACRELAEHLDVNPQVIEDALCNWQKSPAKYVYFRG